jgi:hypothetical protein
MFLILTNYYETVKLVILRGTYIVINFNKKILTVNIFSLRTKQKIIKQFNEFVPIFNSSDENEKMVLL